MPKYIAFLRAINVGGHTVKMERLRQIFESLEFSSVETFIASGNVLFEVSSKNTAALARRIESKLREALGYEVVTFIRTHAELEEIASYRPFPRGQLDQAAALNIAFLVEPLDASLKRKADGSQDRDRRFPRPRTRDLLAVPQEAKRVNIFKRAPGEDPGHTGNFSRGEHD